MISGYRTKYLESFPGSAYTSSNSDSDGDGTTGPSLYEPEVERPLHLLLSLTMMKDSTPQTGEAKASIMFVVDLSYPWHDSMQSPATVYYGVALLLINSVVRFLLPYSDHMIWISLLLLCLNIKTWIVLHIMQNLLLINFQQSSVIQNTDMWLWVAKVLETNETLLCQHITTQQLVIFLYHIFTWILTFTTKNDLFTTNYQLIFFIQHCL